MIAKNVQSQAGIIPYLIDKFSLFTSDSLMAAGTLQISSIDSIPLRIKFKDETEKIYSFL